MNPTPSLKIDQHEPSRLMELIGQAAPTFVTDLNNQGYADYAWGTPDGPVHLERKTWSDLMSGLGSVENQLIRQVHAHEDTRLMLVIEGLVVPSDRLIGGTATLHPTKGNSKLYYVGTQSKVSLNALVSWIYQVSKYIQVFQTPSLEATATAIAAFYRSDQKAEHTTFTRHVKDVTFHPNPQVTSLMGMVPGLGPIKCEALIAKHGTVWEVIHRSPEELAKVSWQTGIDARTRSIGVNEARKWLARIGRPDV